MNFNTIRRHRARHKGAATAIAIAVAAMVTACGGGGGGEDSGPDTIATGAVSSAAAPSAPAPAGAAPNPGSGLPASTPSAQASATTLVVGRVTDATNLTVKRARYDARDASVRVDYANSSASEIKLGMIVEVEAESSPSGGFIARTIAAHSFVEGRIDRIDATNRAIVVNGVTVSVPADTVFDGATGLTDPALRVGASVEVHGYTSPTGGIATRIELKTQDDDSRMTGVVTNLNTTAQTFTLYGRTINYASADRNHLPAHLAEGMLVRVKGTWAGPSVYHAEEVRTGIDFSSSSREGSRSEQEGVVTAFAGLNDLVVNGLQVDASAAEVKGVIAAGARVEVEGFLRNGVLVATKLENKNDDDSPGSSGGGSSSSGEIELRGTVSGLNRAARTLQISNTTVTWDASTEFDDITAGSLANGLFLEVEGVPSASGLHAQKIKLED